VPSLGSCALDASGEFEALAGAWLGVGFAIATLGMGAANASVDDLATQRRLSLAGLLGLVFTARISWAALEEILTADLAILAVCVHPTLRIVPARNAESAVVCAGAIANEPLLTVSIVPAL